MEPRTFVSFESPAPKDGEPPGRELADLLARGLTEAGIELSGPEEHEGWAWVLERSFDGGGIFSIVGLTDDGPIEWQVHSYPRRNRPRLFGGIKGEQLDQEMRAWCEAIHAVLTGEPSIGSIRWYDRKTFGRDHGDTWVDAPTD